MREIKFRAWDKIKRIMDFNPNTMGFGFINTLLTEDSSIVFMQYTGLKDRNGREIYEGDVVRATLIEDELKGFKTNCEALICWDIEDAGFYLETNYDKYPHAKPWNAEYIEVIGNRYENPELLEVDK